MNIDPELVRWLEENILSWYDPIPDIQQARWKPTQVHYDVTDDQSPLEEF